ncbi:hypothetical protein [Rhizobium sp. 007]|uniref:hypothetical protein n=1 Tax=Rhizobium sp. 007 TaxID=2785056 RepID=UPI001FEF38EE|nr:hypothetical protein [Rhizobium sp. 007]
MILGHDLAPLGAVLVSAALARALLDMRFRRKRHLNACTLHSVEGGNQAFRTGRELGRIARDRRDPFPPHSLVQASIDRVDVVDVGSNAIATAPIRSVLLFMGNDQSEMETGLSLHPFAHAKGIGPIGIARITKPLLRERAKRAGNAFPIGVFEFVGQTENVLAAFPVAKLPLPGPQGGIEVGDFTAVLVVCLFFLALVGKDVASRTCAGAVGQDFDNDGVVAGRTADSGGGAGVSRGR